MRHLWVIVAIAASSSAMAEAPNNNAVLRACLTEALTNYTKAKVEFFTSKGGDVAIGTIRRSTSNTI